MKGLVLRLIGNIRGNSHSLGLSTNCSMEDSTLNNVKDREDQKWCYVDN